VVVRSDRKGWYERSAAWPRARRVLQDTQGAAAMIDGAPQARSS
jgi:hypothetical protein